MPIFYIPDGPKNLSNIFTSINFTDVVEYYLEILDASNTTVIATTPINQLQCCCKDDKIRLHFMNYLGTYDAVNFMKPKIIHETSSKEYEKGLPNVLQKHNTGAERFDIKSNDIYEAVTNCYNEEAMLWLQELSDSPKVFLEKTGQQGQADYMLPIIITSKKFDKLKNQNEFRYTFTIEFKLSNEYLTIRN